MRLCIHSRIHIGIGIGIGIGIKEDLVAIIHFVVFAVSAWV